MGKQELIMEYPPENWICPSCGKSHKRPHYAHEGQIDPDKRAGEEGRVRFNRRKKDDSLDHSMEVREGLPAEAPAIDENGNPRSLACPHCGFLAETVVLVRTGKLPSKVDRFFLDGGYKKIPKTWRKLLEKFFSWLKQEDDL